MPIVLLIALLMTWLGTVIPLPWTVRAVAFAPLAFLAVGFLLNHISPRLPRSHTSPVIEVSDPVEASQAAESPQEPAATPVAAEEGPDAEVASLTDWRRRRAS